MARLARLVVPGLPVHVTQRGNYRGTVFDDDESRERYLSFVWQYSQKHDVAIGAYCLMTNHVHFVVVPQAQDSLARCFRGAHMRFSQWVNYRRRQCGHVWQNRYFACLLDEAHLWAAVRYVERNPVRAGLAAQAADYRWSSAAGHCGLRVDKLLAKDFPPTGVIRDWPEWLGDEDALQSEAVRRQTNSGRPCGSVGFMERIEALLGRLVRPQKRGRKPKEATCGLPLF